MNNTAELEGLVVGPYRWSSATYSTFIPKAYNIIKAKVDRVHAEVANIGKNNIGSTKNTKIDKNHHLNYDEEVIQFVKKLISESRLILGNETWVDIIGPELWNLLKLDEKGKIRYNLDNDKDKTTILKKQSIVQLMKVIRDKIEHMEQYKNDMKEKLIEFFDKDENGTRQFNENKFVMFWISKFPKLMPYLWLQFSRFKGKLSNYYTKDHRIDTGSFQNSLLDLNEFEKKLRHALLVDMENGNVLKRFEGRTCSLEFRGYHNKVKIKDTNVFMKFVENSPSNISLSVSNSLSSKGKLEYVGKAPGTESFILIFADNIEDDEVWNYCSNCDCRVIVFCDPKKLQHTEIEKSVEKYRNCSSLGIFEFTESPIKGCELSIEKQVWLHEHGQVSIQGRDFNLKDIFMESCTMASALFGEVLTKLLKCKTVPKLFADYNYPEFNGVYIERHLTLIDQSANYAKFEHIYIAVNYSQAELLFDCFLVEPLPKPIDSLSMYSRIAIRKSFPRYLSNLLDRQILGSSFKQMERLKGLDSIQVFTNVNHFLDKRNKIKSDCEFILLKEPMELSDEIIEKCKSALCSRAVRFLDKMAEEKTTNSFIDKHVPFRKESRRLLCETEFLRLISSKSIKTLFFFAECGMGKSKLITSLGKRLEKGLVIYSTLRSFINFLQQVVGNRESVSKEDLKCVILDMLGCKDKCERNVIEYWLERKGYEGAARIELQLDGLDEVHNGNLKLALTAVEIFEQDFDSVRLWITSSKPYPCERKRQGFAVCTISPFTNSDNVNFFKLAWAKKQPDLCKIKLTKYVHYHLDHFSYTFKLPTEFLSYPLNCCMLAELYEDKFTVLTKFDINVFEVDLYEAMTKLKFARMLSKKIGTKMDEDDNDFKLQREIYIQLHVHLALVYLFPKVLHEFKKPLSMKFLNAENICKLGIVTSSNPLTFVHTSYADFFVARYIIKVLETGDLDYLCSEATFDKILYFGTPDKTGESIRTPIWKIVDNYLRRQKEWSRLKWLKTHKKELHYYVYFNKVSTFISNAVENLFWALVKFLTIVWTNEKDEVVCNEILRMSLMSHPPSTWFISMCEQLNFDNHKTLLIFSVQNERYDIASYLIGKCYKNDVFDDIADMRKVEGQGGGIFHYIVDRIINQNDIIEPTAFVENTQKFITYVHGKNREEVKRKDNNGLNFVQALPLIHSSSIFGFSSEHITSLKKFINEDLDARVGTSFNIEILAQMGRIMHCNNVIDMFYTYVKHDMSALMKRFERSLINLGYSGMEFNTKFLAKTDSSCTADLQKVLQDYIANYDENIKDFNTLLNYCVKNCDDVEFVKKMVESGYKIDVQNEQELCTMCLVEKLGKVELETYFPQNFQSSVEHTCGLKCIKKVQQEKFDMI